MSHTESTILHRTPLYERHVALGARMTPFAGFEMPLQYSGIIDEHMAVRERVGLFDVSHMGEIMVKGPRAFDFVQHLVTNDVSKLTDGRAQYTVMCAEDGGILDDLLVYRLSETRYMLVVNAACVETDLAWMNERNDVGAVLENVSPELALIAVQGPRAIEAVSSLVGESLEELKYYHFQALESGRLFGSRFSLLSRTGYTGEPGVEMYCDADAATKVWDAVMEAGSELGIQAVGLGARDTLRLEAGFCLYGNDITRETNPLEAGLGWLTQLEKGAFTGREALEHIQEDGPQRKLVGFVATERGIPRPADTLKAPDGTEVGHVTSGSQSPVLKKGIGLGYVVNDPAYTHPGAGLVFLSRGREVRCEVRRPPFHK